MSSALAYLDDVRVQFRKMKKLAEDALAQVSDDELLVTLDPESNSLAVIVKHMAGNLRSRFTDFLTSDGEKPDRNRDGEFEIPGRPSRDSVMADWESGWTVLFETLDTLGEDDVLLEVTVRGEALTRHPGAESPDDASLLSRRSDRLSRQALTVGSMAQPEHAEEASQLRTRRPGVLRPGLA